MGRLRCAGISFGLAEDIWMVSGAAVWAASVVVLLFVMFHVWMVLAYISCYHFLQHR